MRKARIHSAAVLTEILAEVTRRHQERYRMDAPIANCAPPVNGVCAAAELVQNG